MKFDPSVYLVVGRSFCRGRELLGLVAEAVAGGVTLVQLREKDLDPRELLELALALKRTLAPSGTPLIINDAVEIARSAHAEGVHLGQSDMSPAEARRILGPGVLIGLSVETREQALAAETLAVDYLGVSPVFASDSKTDTGTPWGLNGLQWLRDHSHHLLVGIGGITPDNAAGVVEAGANGVAVISAICYAQSPCLAARALSNVVSAASLRRNSIRFLPQS